MMRPRIGLRWGVDACGGPGGRTDMKVSQAVRKRAHSDDPEHVSAHTMTLRAAGTVSKERTWSLLGRQLVHRWSTTGPQSGDKAPTAGRLT